MNHLLRIINTVLLLLWTSSAWGFDPGLSGYIIKAGPWQSEYKTMSLFVLPGQKLTFNVEADGQALPFRLDQLPSFSNHIAEGQVSWQAPETPGILVAEFTPLNKDKKESGLPSSKLLIFIMHPISLIKGGKLNGYTIGQYPDKALNGLEIYKPPQGFVEVTKENQDIFISPHYQLKQFLCKQNQGFPKYVVLKTRLLRKLEFLTQVVNERGIATDGFTIMSGYRTPFYNTAIKNKKYSRHQWGGAADIFIDESPKDGKMDDLNKDGKIDVEDARVLWSIVESYYKVPSYKPMIGGLGLYKANAVHGPFIHVDVRGFRARW